MTTKNDTCIQCGLPFKAAISALPLLAGAIASGIAGCTGEDCSPGRRIFRGAIAGGLTAGATVALEKLTIQVCRCSPEPRQ